ncbi:unnamed protein product [Sphagnum balticum]
MRQCWGDSGRPRSQPLQVDWIPIVWSQVPTGEDSNWCVALQWDGDVLGVGGLDVASGGGPAKLLGASCVLGRLCDLVDPFGRGVRVWLPLAYRVTRLGSAIESDRVPGNIGGDDIFAPPVGGVKAHSKGGETFPVLHLRVPELPDPGAA